MREQIIKNIIVPILIALIGSIFEITRRKLVRYLESKNEFINKEKEFFKEAIGILQYNKDVNLVKGAVKTAEQLGKEFNWQGEIKHSKVLKAIEGKTGLSDEEIFYIIKSAVLDNNVDKT